MNTEPTPARRESPRAEALPGRAPAHRWANRLLQLSGWRFDFCAQPEPRVLLIVYPHTSNWDFLWGILAVWASGWPIQWIAKHSLFVGPLGWLLKRWGGIPVNRRLAVGFTERLAQQIRAAPSIVLAITPEGTRAYRDHWKSGFYRIARAADIPIGITYIDYATRTVGIQEYFRLTGDETADLARIAAAYAGKRARDPSLAAPIRFRPPR